MKTLEISETTNESFKSFAEYVENPEMKNWCDSESYKNDKDNSAKKYYRLYNSYKNESDPKGMVSEFLKIKDSLSSEAKTMQTAYDVSGDFVDVDRYLSGEPECMVDYQYEAGVKFIDVTISIGRPWWMKNPEIMKYYAQILSIIDNMENAGFRCKIDIAIDSYEHQGRKNRHITEIEFKNYQEPLDYKTFALLTLDNDMFTHFAIPYQDFFKGFLKSFHTVQTDYYTSKEIKEKQSESSIYFPSVYHTGQNGKYYERMKNSIVPTQKELIKDIGIDFLFPGVE